MVDTPTADTPREPDISHVNPAGKGTWFGHPRQLARLFTTEMWERFGYYGMRALLTLYLTKHFLFSRPDHHRPLWRLHRAGLSDAADRRPDRRPLSRLEALGEVRRDPDGARLFHALLRRRDRPSRTRRSTASATKCRSTMRRPADERPARSSASSSPDGQRLLIRGNEDGSVVAARRRRQRGPQRRRRTASRPAPTARPVFVMLMLVGLSLVAVGNGFFKPNISTIVGSLYAQGDRRRDAGFTIFYMGINLGSLFSQFFCPFLADHVGWWAGFGLAGGRHAARCLPVPVRWRPPRRLWRAARKARPAAATSSSMSARCSRCRSFCSCSGNLMNSPPAARGIGHSSATSLSLPIMGKMLFGTFLIAHPGDPDLVVQGRRHARIPDDARGDGADRLQRRLLDPVRAGRLVADPVRRPQHRAVASSACSASRRRRPRSSTPIFIVLLAPLMSMLWTVLAQARARAIDPGQVRDRADGRRRRLPVPGLGHAVRRARLQGRHLVARRPLPDPLDRRAVHLAGRPEHDHQAVDRADRRPDDGRVVPVDLGRAICRRPRSRRSRASRRSAARSPTCRSASTPMSACSRRSAGSRSASASSCSCCRWPLKKLDARCQIRCGHGGAGRRWRRCCRAARPWRRRPRTAPPVRDQRTIPYPSTYHRLSRAPRRVIRGATVYDGEGGRIDNGTVVLADGVIQAVGGPDTPVPAGAYEIDGTGKFVTPGRHRRPQPSRRLSVARAFEALSDGNEATGPVTARSLGRA